MMLALSGILAALVALRFSAHRGRYLAFPFLVAGLYLAWVLPQMLLLQDEALLPAGGLRNLELMIFLSLVFTLAGWQLGLSAGRRRAAASPPRTALSDEALILPVAVFTAVFFAIEADIAAMAAEEDLGSQWTGRIVILRTLGNLRIITLFLSLLMFFRRQTVWTSALMIANVVLSGGVAFEVVGRAKIMELGMAVLLALWFARRRTVPFPFILAGGAALVLIAFGVAELRLAVKEHRFRTGEQTSILNPEIWGDIRLGAAISRSAEMAPDFRNAVYIIERTDSTGEYTLGSQLWDGFVFRYVPAQIVGSELKDRLLLGEDKNDLYLEVLNQYYFKRIVGTTPTGFGSAYREAGFFGAMLFMPLGFFYGFLWARALDGGRWAQVFYATTVVQGLHAFTHNYEWGWLSLPINAVFLFIIYLLARMQQRFRQPARQAETSLP